MKLKINLLNSRIRTSAILLLVLLLMPTGCSAADNTDAAANDFRAAYAYDRVLPLNASVEVIREDSAAAQYRVEFDSVNGERIPAFLYLPGNAEVPYPCIIVQHGYNGSKDFAGMFAALLNRRGYAVIAIDAQYHGERREEGKDMFSTDVTADVNALIQTVVDLRRVVDYLESRDDIDTERIGYAGASMGSILGALFLGVEERVKTGVLIVGGGDWEKLLVQSEVDSLQAMEESCNAQAGGVAACAQQMSVVDPVNLAPFISPRPMLMISCANDKYVPRETGEALYAAAGEPRIIEWFECTGDIAHAPPIDKTTALLKKWYRKTLGQ